MQNELVKTTTADNLILNGLYSKGDKNKSAVIFIHGFEGDFFSHRFIKQTADLLKQNGNAFVTVQTRGTGIKSEFIEADFEGRIVGAHYELLEEAYLDIDAWIDFLTKEGYNNIVLAGHSLGTLKIIRHQFEGKHKDLVKKLILLCPFDKNGDAEVNSKGEWREVVKFAKQKASEGKGSEYVNSKIGDNYGANSMSYQTFASWYHEDDLGCTFDFYIKDYDFPVLNSLEIPVHTIVGTKDEFLHLSNPENPQEAIDILLKNLKQGSAKLITGATHNFRGYEEIVASEILNFINR